MAVKVKYKKNGEIYLLLGVGYGAYKSQFAGTYIQSFQPETEQGEVTMVAVCNREGEIRWADSGEFTVLEVDGVSPADALKE